MNISRYEKWIALRDVKAVQRVLDHAGYIAGVNTTKKQKQEAVQQMVRRVGVNTEVHPMNANVPEIQHPDARVVSWQKAHDGREWLTEQHAVQPGVQAVGFGMDANAFMRRWQENHDDVFPTGSWEQRHKLSRRGAALTPEEMAGLHNFLFNQFVLRPSMTRWDIAVAGVDGGSMALGEQVVVVADKIDKELFDTYFELSVQTGLIYSSNTQLPLMEMLLASGAVRRWAVRPLPPTSGTASRLPHLSPSPIEGEKFWREYRDYERVDLQQVLADILGTLPAYAFLAH